MNKNKIYPLWPIFVGEFHNEEHQGIKNDLIEFFHNYEKEIKTSRVGVENHNLFESKYNLHKEKSESLSKVFNFIAKGFLAMSSNINKEYVHKLENKNPSFDVNIKNSWFIRYNNGGNVMPHDHGECSLSCVYYVQADDNLDTKNGSTYFLRPFSRGSSHNDFGGLKYASENTTSFKAEEGKLLIWPSFIMHGSKPYIGEKNRIIISANADVILNK